MVRWPRRDVGKPCGYSKLRIFITDGLIWVPDRARDTRACYIKEPDLPKYLSPMDL